MSGGGGEGKCHQDVLKQNFKQVSRAGERWEASQSSKNTQQSSLEAEASGKYAVKRQRRKGCQVLQIAVIATNKNTTTPRTSLERVASCYFAVVVDMLMHEDSIHITPNFIYIHT